MAARRRGEDAKRAILEVAEKHLKEGGPDSVRIHAIAKDLGVTDAAIHHHFGNRKKLMTDLLRFGGRRLREALRDAITSSASGEGEAFDVGRFVAAASNVFGSDGYSRLAIWLTAAGWQSEGAGIWDDLAVEIAAVRGRRSPSKDDRHLAALLAMVLMAEPIFGDAARRSVSIAPSAEASRRFRGYVESTFRALIEAERVAAEQ